MAESDPPGTPAPADRDGAAAPLPAGHWRILARRTLVADRWLRLDAETVQTTTGLVIEPWYIAYGLSWACAVAMTPDRRLVMVEQYRRGADRLLLELPAGNIDGAEQPIDAACRELREESGYSVSGMPQSLGVRYPEPAHNTAQAHGFAMRVEAVPERPTPDAGEQLRVVLLTPPEVELAIQEGRFCHGVQIGFWCTAHSRGLAG